MAGPVATRKLKEDYIVPPFSVLDQTAEYWKDRKRKWLGLGIKSELGRGEVLHVTGTSLAESQARLNKFLVQSGHKEILPGGGGGSHTKTKYRRKRSKANAVPGGGAMPIDRAKNAQLATGRTWGQDLVRGENSNFGTVEEETLSGTSIFDPVLCEVMYRWFAGQPSARILDPFAGGSVRGVVAAAMGHRYVGFDLREEQVKANQQQWEHINRLIKDRGGLSRGYPAWIHSEAQRLKDRLRGWFEFDFVFSCPPYFDLEQYSDSEHDLSNMDWDEFLRAYRRIIRHSIDLLADNRFACFVIGDRRDPKTGIYRNLVGETIDAFRAAEAEYYNQMVLLTPVGSAQVRARKQFDAGRKVVMLHQYVLVFVKGDPAKAHQAYPIHRDPLCFSLGRYADKRVKLLPEMLGEEKLASSSA